MISKEYETNNVYIPNLGGYCLCCNKETSGKKKIRLNGVSNRDYIGGKIDIPICKKCKNHVPSNYENLIPISILTFLFSIFFLVINTFEFHAATIILLLLGVSGVGFTFFELFKRSKWKKRGHFPNYYINPIPNKFIFTSNNLSLMIRLIELNQEESILLEMNKELEIKWEKKLTTGL